MWEVNAKIRNEREMGRAVEKEKRMCQNAHFGFTLIVSLILYISRVSCSKNKNFSPLMPINLIVSLIEESKRLRGKERKRQRDKETKRKRGKDKNQENPLKSMAAAPLL